MVAIDSVSTNNAVLAQRKNLVEKLFECKSHRSTGSRIATIMWWTEAENLSSNSFNSKIQFLQNVWSDCNFRPFDDVASSVKHLTSHMNQDFLIRLSTSQPGGVTLTFRRELKSEKIVHTRFSVDGNSHIVDSYGKPHKTISSLAKWFSSHRYRNQQATPAGYVFHGN